MSTDNTPISEMSDLDIQKSARKKLAELAAHDLRWHMARFLNVKAGGPIEGGFSDFQMVRAQLRQLLADIADSQPTELE